MVKTKKNNSSLLLLLVSVVWFLSISFVTAQTEYYLIVANLADPQGVATPFENILRVLIVIVSFMPSGLALAIPYVKKEFKDHLVLRTLLLSLGIALALYIPFSWYNFIINFRN